MASTTSARIAGASGSRPRTVLADLDGVDYQCSNSGGYRGLRPRTVQADLDCVDCYRTRQEWRQTDKRCGDNW